MRDDDFEYFIEKFGDKNLSVDVPQNIFDKYRKIFCERLISYWKEEGWCSFKNGLLWIVNPDEYDDITAASVRVAHR